MSTLEKVLEIEDILYFSEQGFVDVYYDTFFKDHNRQPMANEVDEALNQWKEKQLDIPPIIGK